MLQVTSKTTVTNRTSGPSRTSRSSPKINSEQLTGESQLSNSDERNQKNSKVDIEEGKKHETRREEKEDTSTGPALARIFLDFSENETDERSPEEPVRQGPHLSIRIGIWILPSDTETSAATP